MLVYKTGKCQPCLTKLGFCDKCCKAQRYLNGVKFMAFLNGIIQVLEKNSRSEYFISHPNSQLSASEVINPEHCQWDPIIVEYKVVHYLTRYGTLRDKLDGKIALIQVGEVKNYFVCHYNAWFSNSDINNIDNWQPIAISQVMAIGLQPDDSKWICSITTSHLSGLHIGDDYRDQTSAQAWEGVSNNRAAQAYDIRIGRLGRR